jgi:hypothetical protein
MTNDPTLNASQVTSTVEAEQKAVLPVLALFFSDVTEYTTFRAELAVTEGDLVFHFYPTPAAHALKQPTPLQYWTELFPECLDRVARQYFNADESRLSAAYTEEMASWWLRGFGFGHVLEPQKFAYGFLAALDAALDGAITSAA